jgi:hypothetical protein
VAASTGWNYTTQELSSLLEAPGSERPEDLRRPSTLAVMFLWRLANPHMLSQAMLAAILLARTRQWLLLARRLLFLPIIATCALSVGHVAFLRAKL